MIISEFCDLFIFKSLLFQIYFNNILWVIASFAMLNSTTFPRPHAVPSLRQGYGRQVRDYEGQAYLPQTLSYGILQFWADSKGRSEERRVGKESRSRWS